MLPFMLLLALGASPHETLSAVAAAPGHATPHIPEPMIFDLVRGLGAAQGEVEVNVLVLAQPDLGRVAWAPEVEWAFAPGYAIELELPLVDRNLEAVKVALQGTLPFANSERFIHGWQVLSEVELEPTSTRLVGLYLAGFRFNSVLSALLMAGGRADIPGNGARATGGFVGNASLFLDAGESHTWGLETNVSILEQGDWTVRLFPQGHLRLSKHLRLQFSLGLEVQPERVSPAGGFRFVLESS